MARIYSSYPAAKRLVLVTHLEWARSETCSRSQTIVSTGGFDRPLWADSRRVSRFIKNCYWVGSLLRLALYFGRSFFPPVSIKVPPIAVALLQSP